MDKSIIDKSIIYELKEHNIKDKDIDYIMNRVKNRFCEENIDIELKKLGYEKIFTIDYDEYDFLDEQYMED